MFRIVTVEREYGCGGSEIAQRLAERLGWKLWDELLTREIAHLAHCSQSVVEQHEERTDPLYYRLMKSFMRGSYEGSLNAPKLNLVDSETILKITQNVVLRAAGKGESVIVGRGSQLFLKDRPDTFRVFLYAPRDAKIRRLLARGKNESEAQELVDTVDRERANFLERYFHVEWPSRAVYHVMINTGAGDANVVQSIVDVMKSAEPSAS
ncbi:MAG TPA: cytidylate kinase-like family protein [Candidatus Acidoferrales bacterium]|nr:cytidylate kinase-like family protein [Candidatus Acidoferrales bacterium]